MIRLSEALARLHLDDQVRVSGGRGGGVIKIERGKAFFFLLATAARCLVGVGIVGKLAEYCRVLWTHGRRVVVVVVVGCCCFCWRCWCWCCDRMSVRTALNEGREKTKTLLQAKLFFFFFFISAHIIRNRPSLVCIHNTQP